MVFNKLIQPKEKSNSLKFVNFITKGNLVLRVNTIRRKMENIG